jgi:hypothetical protein
MLGKSFNTCSIVIGITGSTGKYTLNNWGNFVVKKMLQGLRKSTAESD